MGWIMCASVVLAIGAAAGGNPGGMASGGRDARTDLAEQALRMLQEGNQRFVSGRPVHPNADVFRIRDTGEHGQHPFATIVTCADSRVAVERLFDRGVGDLFVVRVAGNVSDPNQNGSVEYACEHLGTRLVVVMGHTRCGAVKAAVEGGHGDPGSNIGSLLDNIAPAVQSVRAAYPDLTGDELVDAAVRENVWRSVEDLLRGTPSLRGRVESGEVRVVGAVYDVASGAVEWMGQHPAQSGLLKAVAASTPPAPAQPAAAQGEKKPEKVAAEKSAAEKSGFVKPTPKPGPKESAGVGHEAGKQAEHASHPH